MSIKNNTTSLQGVLEALTSKATGGMELPILTNEGTAADLLSGKQLIDQDGNIVTGTIQTKAATTYTPTASNQTIASGTYLTGTQTIKGDSNLVAENIKSGVSIFGVAGSYEGSSDNTNSFPYKVTVVTSGIDGVEPVICYGDDGKSFAVFTYANSTRAYDSSWSYTNCTLSLSGTDGIKIGDYALFHSITGDATVTVTWVANDSDY